MRHRFEVVVRLKEGLLDPQGKAVEGALPHMGWTNVSDVRVGKHVELAIDAPDEDGALEQAREIATRLLANPVIEVVEVRRAPGSPTAPGSLGDDADADADEAATAGIKGGP